MAPDFADRTDFENAARGLVDPGDPVTIRAADGRVVFDLEPYAYLAGDVPGHREPEPVAAGPAVRRPTACSRSPTASTRCAGFDLSNMTIVEGDTGVIVIDPLISAECAAAALALYREHRGDRPVTGVIYTHSHGDHFGGVLGVLPDGRGDVPILAPEGFLEHAVSENVYAGTAMTRRANYMYGADACRSRPTGQVEHRAGHRHVGGLGWA